MIRASIHDAKTHLSRLLREVQRGETVVILHGKSPVAQLVPIQPPAVSRPRPGKATTSGVRWAKDAFEPLSPEEMEIWGL